MKNRKGFTLVEMLIVIVIIGVLAAAILPNLLGTKDKAQDTARIAGVNNLHTAIISYSHVAGEYPAICGNAASLMTDANTKQIMSAQVDKIPTDPNKNNEFKINNTDVKGNYGYCGIKKWGNSNTAYVVVAKVADPAKANYVVTSGDPITADGLTDKNYEDIKKKICSKINISDAASASTSDNSECNIKSDDFKNLRYVVVGS